MTTHTLFLPIDNQKKLDSNSQETAPSHYWLLLILNFPLLSEVIRKYLYQSDMVFFGAGVIVVLAACWTVFQHGSQIAQGFPPLVWLFATTFLVWAFINQFIAAQSLMMFSIGTGTIILPFLYMIVSSTYYQSGHISSRLLFLCVCWWLILIGIVALTQEHLGSQHPFTRYGLGSTGIGNYTVDGEGIRGFFRPTSIFTHTGKFGQALFCLILFKWTYLLIEKQPLAIFWKVSVLLDIVTLVVSGQRSAFLFLLLCCVILLAMWLKQNGGRALQVGSVALILALPLGWMVLEWIPTSMLSLIIERFASAFYDAPERVIGNLLLPFWTMVDKYPFFGEGLGAFTLGSGAYGGQAIYKAIEMPGFGENSWIRLIGEVGLVGCIIFMIMIAQMIIHAWKGSLSKVAHPCRSVNLFYFLWLFSVIAWANTHDTIGNIVVMSLGFALGGAILGKPHANSTDLIKPAPGPIYIVK